MIVTIGLLLLLSGFLLDLLSGGYGTRAWARSNRLMRAGVVLIMVGVLAQLVLALF